MRTHSRPIDYAGMVCPETERIYATEAVHLPHALFLGGRHEMDVILEAIEKIWRNRKDLSA